MKQLNIGIIGAGRIGKVHMQSITYNVPSASKQCATVLVNPVIPSSKFVTLPVMFSRSIAKTAGLLEIP